MLKLKPPILSATLALALTAAPAGAAVDSVVAARPDGGASFAWTPGGAPGLVEERTLDASGAFGDSQFVSPARRQAVARQIGTDADGNALIAWLGHEDGAWAVRVRRRTADGGLSAGQRLTPAGAAATDVKLDVEPDGDAVVVWTRALDGRPIIQARRRAADGTLGPVLTLSYAAADALAPDVAIGPDGSATVVWLRGTATESGFIQRVQARTMAADGSLGAIQAITPTTYSAMAPRVTFAESGTAVIAWTSDSPGPARYRLRTAAGELGTPVTLAPSAMPESLAIARNGAGRVAFAWTAVDGPEHRVTGRVRAAGGGLGAVFDLGGATDDQAAPAVALDPQGTATFAWLENADGAATVHLRRRTSAGAFGQLRMLSDPTLEARAPHLAVDGAGKATVAWLDQATGQHQARTITAGGTVSPVRQVSGG